MSVAKNLEDIRAKIQVCTTDAKRSVDAVTLVAVSKKQDDARIDEALAAGQRVFGENRVQEAMARWGSFQDGRRAAYPDIKLHLIGALQSNKAADAVALFDVIESVDREKIAKALAREMKSQGRSVRCLIQVNTGEESQKAGLYPRDVQAFYAFCTRECGLDISGLMCIPPVDEPAALHFALLKKYADQLGVRTVSMGMSTDYELAIMNGATHVRVGTGVFGARTA